MATRIARSKTIISSMKHKPKKNTYDIKEIIENKRMCYKLEN